LAAHSAPSAPPNAALYHSQLDWTTARIDPWRWRVGLGHDPRPSQVAQVVWNPYSRHRRRNAIGSGRTRSAVAL